MNTRMLTIFLSFGALLALQAEPFRVYFGTSGKTTKGIYTSTFDPSTGTLSESKLAAEIKSPGFITIHPNNKYLYASSSNDGGSVAGFAIQPDGSLTAINQQSCGGKGPCHVNLDATGKCLMVANYGSGGVASYQISPDNGQIAASKSVHQHEGSSVNERRQKGPHAHSIFAGPTNDFAYAPDLGIDKVMIYKLNPTEGKLTASGSANVPAGSGPRHMKFGKNGAQAYVLNEMTLSISVFDVNRDGTFSDEKQNLSTFESKDGNLEGMSCSEIRVHPSGKFIYGANRDSTQDRDSIAVFEINTANGQLNRIEIAPANVDVPRNFNIDPTGNWLLAGGQRSDEVAVFAIDTETGNLTFTGKKISTPSPICIEFLEQ